MSQQMTPAALVLTFKEQPFSFSVGQNIAVYLHRQYPPSAYINPGGTSCKPQRTCDLNKGTGQGTSGRLRLSLAGRAKVLGGLDLWPLHTRKACYLPSALSVYPLLSEPRAQCLSFCLCGHMFRCTYMCRFMCAPAYGQIRGNPLKSASSFGYSPCFILGGEGWGLSLTRNLL